MLFTKISLATVQKQNKEIRLKKEANAVVHTSDGKSLNQGNGKYVEKVSLRVAEK